MPIVSIRIDNHHVCSGRRKTFVIASAGHARRTSEEERVRLAEQGKELVLLRLELNHARLLRPR